MNNCYCFDVLENITAEKFVKLYSSARTSTERLANHLLSFVAYTYWDRNSSEVIISYGQS